MGIINSSVNVSDVGSYKTAKSSDSSLSLQTYDNPYEEIDYNQVTNDSDNYEYDDLSANEAQMINQELNKAKLQENEEFQKALQEYAELSKELEETERKGGTQ